MKHDERGDLEEIDGLVSAFFQLFTNRAGARLDLERIFSLFVPSGLIVKCGSGEPAVSGLEEFIAPRRLLLTNGRLVEFEERETSGSTTIFGDGAHRISLYEKSGVLDGQVFSTRGLKTFQFIRTGGGWRILSVVWDDERDGLSYADLSAGAPIVLPS